MCTSGKLRQYYRLTHCQDCGASLGGSRKACLALALLIYLSHHPEVTLRKLQMQIEPRKLVALACLKATLKVFFF